MTEDSMALVELLGKHQGEDPLRVLGQFVLQQLMEAEAQGLCGALRHERNEERVNQRNGYREREFHTRLGTMSLRVPKLRQGSYFPSFLEARKSSERALVAVVQEAYLKGVSTRKVDDLVQAMGMTGISKSEVSRLCKELDERVNAFMSRPLEGRFPFVWLDATYLKVRVNGRVVSRAMVVAIGAHEDGHREVLGLSIGPGETHAFWHSFLRELIERGLSGVELVISDAHEGLKRAIAETLCTTWQRCRVHFLRNALSAVPRVNYSMISALLRTAFAEESAQAVRVQWRENAQRFSARLPKLTALMEEAEEDVLAFTAFPRELWPRLNSTNPLERVNKEIKRRARVVEIFPNDAAAIRLVGALLAEQHDEWQVARRYIPQETLTRILGDDQHEHLWQALEQQAA